MLRIRFVTNLYAHSLVSLRNSIDGWDTDVEGTYINGAWQFDLEQAKYQTGFEYKFFLPDALGFNDGPNLSIDSPPPVIPRPLVNPLPNARGRMIDPDFESPYTQQWNIGFAQEVGRNMSLEFDFVHILGLHEFVGFDINPRIGPLIGADRNDPNPPRLLAPLFAAHAAELIAEFGTATPFGRISVAQSDGRSRCSRSGSPKCQGAPASRPSTRSACAARAT